MTTNPSVHHFKPISTGPDSGVLADRLPQWNMLLANVLRNIFKIGDGVPKKDKVPPKILHGIAYEISST